MNNKMFTYDSLPDSANFQPGVHKLTIVEAEEITASTGTYMLQLSYAINDTDAKLNRDNCPLIKADGTNIAFGATKMKRILTAINVTPKNFTLKTLIPLIKGKSFQAEITKNEKGYWTLENIDTIKPLETKPVANLTVEESAEEVLIDVNTDVDIF